MSNEEILRSELEKVKDEAIQLYRSSGKRVTGNWETGNRVEADAKSARIYAFAYLAGRGRTVNGNKGEPTLRQRILEWLQNRGIRPIEDSMRLSTLAFLIARKIHREGTDKSRHRRVFEEILTPNRIQEIINNVGRFNIEMFTEEVEVSLTVLKKSI